MAWKIQFIHPTHTVVVHSYSVLPLYYYLGIHNSKVYVNEIKTNVGQYTSIIKYTLSKFAATVINNNIAKFKVV